jgi:hypothetical protein
MVNFPWGRDLTVMGTWYQTRIFTKVKSKVALRGLSTP